MSVVSCCAIEMRRQILIILAVCVAGCYPANVEVNSAAQLAEPIGTADTWIAACTEQPELCVPRCQRDAQFCAQRINNHVLAATGEPYRFQEWQRYSSNGLSVPNSMGHGRPNVQTPMHGAYLKTYVNPVAARYIETLEVEATDVDRVDFPNGSIIVKHNAINADMDSGKSPWITVMFKLDGYCHADFGGAGPCIGGEWFYYLHRGGNFLKFDNVPAFGKAQAFCIDCHGPAEKGDWLWTTMYNVNQAFRSNRPTVTVSANEPARKNVIDGCEDVRISSELPGDVAQNPAAIDSAEQRQRMFDCLSWQSFIALNWPGDTRAPGRPAEAAFDRKDGPRVWETYRSAFEVFQPDLPEWTLQDKQWTDPFVFDAVCESQSREDKVLRMTGKNRGSSIVDETHEAFGNQFNQLIDQNGNRTLFEVRMNRDEFEFLKETGYADTGRYSTGGPLDHLSWQSDPLQMPDNVRGSDRIPLDERVGAIEVKASWRVMCTDRSRCNKVDDLSHYYVRDALFYERDPLGGEGSCQPAKVGLVGLHISHKTFWSPQWVWSTFEHVENVPEVSEFPQVEGTHTPFSYYNPALARKQPPVDECRQHRPGVEVDNGTSPTAPTDINACPNLQNITNSHPKKVGSTAVAADTGLTPNQITRLDPVTRSSLNEEYRDKLREMNSPFYYYQLVNTQWALHGRGEPLATTVNLYPCTDELSSDCYVNMPVDLKLRNTSMESFQVTFAEETTHPSGQTSSGGCIQCHGRTDTDFSYVWTDAVEELVPQQSVTLSDPPRGTYPKSCEQPRMQGRTLRAMCANYAGEPNNTSLENAHACEMDIANLNGKLVCYQIAGSFTESCDKIDIENSVLSAQCLRLNGVSRQSAELDISGYGGLVSNCDGALIRGRCEQGQRISGPHSRN